MPEDADVMLAQLLLSHHFVELDVLHEAVEYQRKEKSAGRFPGTLGDLLVAQGALPRAVFKALDTDTGEIIALKILPPATAKEEDSHLERFLREARVALSLSHPNIVQGKKLGNVKGIYYYAMEYIDGKSVADVLDDYGLLDEADALEIVRQTCKGLEYAAKHDIVHRDVKPDNILITLDGVVKLADLGLAKVPMSDAKVTASGITLGTPHYISPEQVRGRKDIDVRSDIYALGISLYEMVTGGTPFDGDSMGVVIAKQLNDAIPPARDVRPDLSIAIEYIIDNMTQKDRSKRYQDTAAVMKDIDGLTGGKKRPALRFT